MADEALRNCLADLDSDNTAMQMDALRRLADLGPQARSAVPTLIAIKAFPEYMSDPDVRNEIQKTLAKMGEAGIHEIVSVLEDGNEPERTRMEAAASLANLGKAGFPFLLAAMDHQDLAVRLFSVDALPATGDLALEAIARLEDLLQDQTNVGNSAAIALAYLAREEKRGSEGSKSADAVLLQGFERGTPLTRRRIVDALGFLDEKNPAFMSIMDKALKDEDEDIRETASRVIEYVSKGL